jgi:hypothetical protein
MLLYPVGGYLWNWTDVIFVKFSMIMQYSLDWENQAVEYIYQICYRCNGPTRSSPTNIPCYYQ